MLLSGSKQCGRPLFYLYKWGDACLMSALVGEGSNLLPKVKLKRQDYPRKLKAIAARGEPEFLVGV